MQRNVSIKKMICNQIFTFIKYISTLSDHRIVILNNIGYEPFLCPQCIYYNFRYGDSVFGLIHNKLTCIECQFLYIFVAIQKNDLLMLQYLWHPKYENKKARVINKCLHRPNTRLYFHASAVLKNALGDVYICLRKIRNDHWVYNALEFACSKGDKYFNIISFLLEKIDVINTEYAGNLLIVAIKARAIKTLKTLIKYGINVNMNATRHFAPFNETISMQFEYPIIVASNWGSVSCLQILLQNQVIIPSNLLMWAITGGNWKIVHYLYKRKNKYHLIIPTDFGFRKTSVLFLAMQEKINFNFNTLIAEQKLVSLILNTFDFNDININGIFQNDYNVLMHAANLNSWCILPLLITHGADVNAKNVYGRTALMQAIIFNNRKCIDCLITFGAKLNDADNKGITVEDYARKLSFSLWLYVYQGFEKRKKQTFISDFFTH